MKSPDTRQQAEEFFHDKIPLTRAMGVRVIADDDAVFAVEAPVALNHNHLQTAFGGSINAVATLAGYGFLWNELRGQPAHIVIAQSSIRFLQPVREMIRALCLKPTAEELAAFHSAYGTTGKAKMTLRVRVEENGRIAAEFEGTFVALRDRST